MNSVRAFLISVMAASALLAGGVAVADEGDASRLGAGQSLIGQHSTLEVDVVTDRGATVEVDPASESWVGVEVVRIESVLTVPQGERDLHRMTLVVAPFIPGDVTFAPAVNVVAGSEVTPRQLPPVAWRVLETLPPDAPLDLSPIAGPRAIAGAESPLLKPLIWGGVAVGVLLAAALIYGILRWAQRRMSRPGPVFEPGERPVGLEGAADLLLTDPVAGYRTLAATIRGVIADRYRLPAHALTTNELQRRMESQGIDRWQARLVGGLLEECDQVIYAGYRPAMERREHDLTMARMIVAGGNS